MNYEALCNTNFTCIGRELTVLFPSILSRRQCARADSRNFQTMQMMTWIDSFISAHLVSIFCF